MSTSTPQDPHHRTGAAIPRTPGHPASPGPDPDDINKDENASRHAGRHADDGARPVTPTSPGPDPDDLDNRP